MTFLTDTHCHLNFNSFKEDLTGVLDRANQSLVEKIMVPAIDLSTSREIVTLCEKHPQLFAAVGVHPNDANTWDSNTIMELQTLAKHPKVLAIGEIGLDFYRDHSTPLQQQKILAQQLELAAELRKPIILHSRNSIANLWPQIKDWWEKLPQEMKARPGVFHSFDGSLELAQEITAHQFLLGISGPVTFTNAKERQALVSGLSLQNILLETDAPFLSPHPHRGQRNEPSYIPLIAQKIADLHLLSIESVAEETTRSAGRLFAWE